MTTQEIQQEALTRAASGQSVMNYAGIFQGFMAMGIAESDIRPRENVFTFWAWKALGRRVMKGQHGVKACTFVPVKGQREESTQEQPALQDRSGPNAVL
jgi:hypothetical protein